MELLLQPTKKTPLVRINQSERMLEMSGRSSPENAIEFYDKVYAAVDNYFNDEKILVVKMQFEYFNTSSSKCIFMLFKKMKSYVEDGKNIKIHWIYDEDDEDMMEAGEDY
ncbi:MAG: DUF1987 domain-containing protein, partial [Cyclobacteriaceae bacterium]|nr:DUF1987 domain-containing protein [Cyclobacteriaceae bacterium]